MRSKPSRSPFASFVTALVALALIAGSARADEKTYQIKFVRPPQVGQKYTMTAEGALTRRTTISASGQQVSSTDEEYGVHLEGTVEVLAVNKDGEEGKVACTVTKCTRIAPEGEEEIAPAGRVITATGGKEETTFSIDQGVLP